MMYLFLLISTYTGLITSATSQTHKQPPLPGQPTYSTLIRIHRSHNRPINSLAWSPDKSQLALQADLDEQEPHCPRTLKQNIELYDTTLSSHRESLDGTSRTGATKRLAWSPDGHMLASGNTNGSVDVWLLEYPSFRRTFPCPANAAHTSIGTYAIAWAPDSKHLAWGSTDKHVYVWDSLTGKLYTFGPHAHSIWAVAWSPDNTKIAAGSRGSIHIWNRSTHEQICSFGNADDTDPIYAIAWSQDHSTIATSSKSTEGGKPTYGISLWSTKSYKLITILIKHTDAIQMLTWAPNGSILVSASYDGTINLWDSSNNTHITTLRHPSNPAKFMKSVSCTWSPDSNELATTFDNEQHGSDIIIWQINHPKTIAD